MAVDRVRELEKEFIIWSNIFDEELVRYYSNKGSYSKKYLSDEEEYFHKLLEELDSKNEEYLCLAGAKWAHPNFEKCNWRLNIILDLIYAEIESRKK